MRNAFLGISILLAVPALAAAPAWLQGVEGADNARWLLFGGATGVAEAAGLEMRGLTSSEGDLKPAERGGAAGARSVRENGKMGYFYIEAESHDLVREWLGKEHDVLLSVRYFDAAKGRFTISYDSSDERIKRPPYEPGVWRQPDTYPEGVELLGDGTWKTVTMRLEFAHFAKRQHSADIRLDPYAEDFALAGIAITPVLKQAAARLRVTQELRIERAEGLIPLAGAARFAGTFAQTADQPIVMEAAAATTLSLQEGRAPGLDEGAWSGACIHFVDAASWRFTVASPGRYVMWQRARFPWGGHWNHDEVMDGRTGNNVSDAHAKGVTDWQWVRAAEYDLSVGEHTFSMSYHGGAQLDVLVLSRTHRDEPPDLERLVSSYRGARTGEVWTTLVRPLDVDRWLKVSFGTSSGADSTFRLSTDDGRTWRDLDPTAPLDDLPVAGGGVDSLRFHVSVRGREGAPPPVVLAETLQYRAGPNNIRAVENERLRIEFDPVGVKRIIDKSRQVPISEAAQLHGALAMILAKPPGDAAAVGHDLYGATFEDLTVAEDGTAKRVTMAHRLSTGMRLVTRVRLRPDGHSEWQLTIENPTALEVAEIRFPVITGCQLGGNPADDWIFVPKCWGQVWQDPAKSGRLQTYWGTSMRWLGMWDKTHGLYLGIEDERFDDYGFVFGGDGSGGTTIAPCQRVLVKPRSTWTSAVYRLAVTGPDWHEGADICRAYNARTLKPCTTHPYVKWLVDRWQTQPSNDAPWAGWDMVAPGGEPLMAANRQMLDGADSGYCGLYPYPSTAWGSTREFAQKLAVRRALGGMYTPYHNFHLWAPGYGHYPRIGTFAKSALPDDIPKPDDDWYRAAATYSYDGQYARTETDPFAQRGMAMGSRQWRDWLADWTDRYIDWGADGMYYDQFNMVYANGRLYPDFDTYGCWMPATLEVIARARAAAQAKNPYYTASAEVCNDVYGQFIDLHMTSGVFNRLEFFTYCNPRQLLIDGGWNGGLGEAFGGQQRVRFIWQVGARGEGCLDNRQLALRRAVKSVLYDADFMDTVGVVVKDRAGKLLTPERHAIGQGELAAFRGVIARWFLFRDGAAQRGAVVNLINFPIVKGATVTLDTSRFGPVRAAMAWTLEGRSFPLHGTSSEGAYTFPVPESELSSVVLSGGMRPVVQWRLAPPVAAGGAAKLAVALANVNADPQSGTARLRLPDGWPVPAPAAFGPLEPGGTVTFSLTVPVPESARRGRHDVWCDVVTPAGTFAAYSLLVVNDAVVADLRGTPGRYHLWFRNLSDRSLPGRVELSAPAGLTVHGPGPFSLPPRSTVRLPVGVDGQEGLATIGEMSARVTVGKQTMDLVRAIMPAVPNGNFELDSAGDRRPDWWMCRKVRDEWSYERLHLADGGRDGGHCLKLDPPQTGEEFTCAYPVHSVLATNAQYRIAVWIKAASPDGVYASVLGRQLGRGQTTPEWQQFAVEVATGSGPASLARVLYNHSNEPGYFDDLTVELLPQPRQ